MKNIELKVSIAGVDGLSDLLGEIGAESAGTLRQVDTYYQCSKGRLKIREINEHIFQLIFYERPNTRDSRMSDYQLLEMAAEQSREMKLFLSETFGETVVVRKERRLWLYRNTRIHLDTVEGLGDHLELETRVAEGHISRARREHDEVIQLLGLSKLETFGGSYSDMLLQKQSTHRS